MKHKLFLIFGAIAATTLSPDVSRAACVGAHSEATLSYIRKLRDLPEFAYQALKTQHAQRYNITPSAWANRGWTANVQELINDSRTDYGKHFYASTFVEHAVHFGPKTQIVFQWDGQVAFIDTTTRGFHANDDYSSIARGISPAKQHIVWRSHVSTDGWRWSPEARLGLWHMPNVHTAEDGDGSDFARYETHWEWNAWNLGFAGSVVWNSSSTRDIITYCLLYDPGLAQSTIAGIASTLVHEGWHSRDMKPMTGHHVQDPDKICGMSDNPDRSGNCDTWYSHGKLEFDVGDTFFSTNNPGPFNNGDPNKRRSPLSSNQLQIEYLCDVADSGQPWVPFSVVDGAAKAALGRKNRFSNRIAPEYDCGMPTPMYAVPVGERTTECGGGVRCDTDADCGGTEEVCSTIGCCYRDIIK